MKMAAAIIGFLALLGSAAQAAPAKAPLLELKAKSVSYGLVQPIPPITNIVVASLNGAQKLQLDDCLRTQHKPPRNYRALLLWGVFPSSPAHRLHVVRPSERYCSVFYGASDMAYYLIDERPGAGPAGMKLVLANRGDRLLVLPAVTNGLNEIEATGCNGGKCRIARMAFDGRTYRPVECEESEVRGKGEVRRPRRCGSDGFADDKAPVSVPQPKR
jgi:hypothetical protein